MREHAEVPVRVVKVENRRQATPRACVSRTMANDTAQSGSPQRDRDPAESSPRTHSATSEAAAEKHEPLSKRQRKKLLKQQRWEEERDLRR